MQIRDLLKVKPTKPLSNSELDWERVIDRQTTIKQSMYRIIERGRDLTEADHIRQGILCVKHTEQLQHASVYSTELLHP